jgi:hypothetical protein
MSEHEEDPMCAQAVQREYSLISPDHECDWYVAWDPDFEVPKEEQRLGMAVGNMFDDSSFQYFTYAQLKNVNASVHVKDLVEYEDVTDDEAQHLYDCICRFLQDVKLAFAIYDSQQK